MKNGDSPAFHQATEWNPISDLRGLTKREYFAAMAMQGIMSNSADVICNLNDNAKAYYSVRMADLLLNNLES